MKAQSWVHHRVLACSVVVMAEAADMEAAEVALLLVAQAVATADTLVDTQDDQHQLALSEPIPTSRSRAVRHDQRLLQALQVQPAHHTPPAQHHIHLVLAQVLPLDQDTLHEPFDHSLQSHTRDDLQVLDPALLLVQRRDLHQVRALAAQVTVSERFSAKEYDNFSKIN